MGNLILENCTGPDTTGILAPILTVEIFEQDAQIVDSFYRIVRCFPKLSEGTV